MGYTKLGQEGYHVHVASNGQEALNYLENTHIDLMVADIMMPVMDGYSLVKLFRESGQQLPILMMTAKSQFESLEEAFELGVDDYLVKPIILSELVLRIKALLRRVKLEHEQELQLANCKLQYQSLILTDLKTSLIEQLPPKEFYVLYKLLSTPQKIFTRLDLLDDIWGMEEDYDERVVDACIKRIRQKCKDYQDFDIITIRGLGYKGQINHGQTS
ncbi:DNA-binding response regulator [Streptococcus dysgalactiae subsp. dysgalactiae]|uniref:response regulator transcription factor n=1 Tax=Streptococcus dysgalactiae TaxID=1334 RepID=UPI000617E088|nr:response regulator transcription factor [Streptococcus dysgalactiae]KKC22266.1 transcriptional regulator [Streptococcus dysgalactiae subsp. equisimilis]MBM6513943.1 response regulator transcription factor [Streptococcus dysgalactiae subsp. equisimilis]MBM6533803.1 response regulator transcription factor [Streptococcus dysgalactiae subsp. equisimilis]MBM6548111.1 response regulator transcription factor [Streptococcus dysgalactiae subsp. equisimilis]MQA58874.1 response regulator [Streptococcu